ncbi:MAG: 16S rRNA (guanine(966)-N(2))-methyltransferase RsmD [Candidatus Saganbacteria bacterium]|nr:16S rRNA (guanine(966)-N(2))-methyltransferase RsmD [Candidatus Saganbacteria bacterium]
MRVISGSAKGRKLKVPKTDIRPLSDRSKEALFNILISKVSDASFLDLFAGSGSVGIEALSRGAKLSFFVEQDKRHVRIIKENLADLSFEERGEVYSLDVLKALKILSSKGAKFDIIFLGAPYNSPVLKEALIQLGDLDLLNPLGVVVAEYRFKQKIDSEFNKISRFREEKYGDTILAFYERKI